MSLQSGTFKKAYLEITNVCNASCSFCPKTKRAPRMMSEDEFELITDKLVGRVEYLYLHLMGEPLLHPSVLGFVAEAKNKGFKVMITSNGILSEKVGIPLISTGTVTKISLSLHSYEANSFGVTLENYLNGCLSLADSCAENKTVCALRLWNKGHMESLNSRILEVLKERYGDTWETVRGGYKLSDYVFFEWGDHFEWPDPTSEQNNIKLFCHGLRNQIGVLSDGTVVPCCLDSEGRIPLGNILGDTLDTVLSSERAKALYDGFSAHTPSEELCRTCGYATRFETE